MRQTAVIAGLTATLALTACGGGPKTGDVGFVEGFLGGVMADEPRAALVGRDTLSAGGSAVDAAVAAYFTMAVTFPSGAGLGGGGVCLVYDGDRKQADAFEFLPRAPAGGGDYAIPGNVRGMFALHARYGLLNWADLLRPAEQLARDGHPISRALAREIQANTEHLRRHPETARAFGITQAPVREGALLQQIPLSAILSSVRVRGAGDFYQGASARQFVNAVAGLGGSLTLEDMRGYLPRLETPLTATAGTDTIYFSDAGGIVAGRTWALLHDEDRFSSATDDAARAQLVAAASASAYGATQNGAVSIAPDAIKALVANPPRPGEGRLYDPASQNGAALVVADRFGQTVACSYTMGRPFGTGVFAPGTGILLAPAETKFEASQPAAMLVVNEPNALSILGAASSGGSPASLARLPLDTRGAAGTLRRSIAAPRLYSAGNPATIVFEESLEPAAVDALRALGKPLRQVGALGRADGFYCPDGLPRSLACEFVVDDRGSGLAASADK